MEKIDWSKAPVGYPLWLEFLKKALTNDARRKSGGEWVSDCGGRYETMRGTFWSKPEEGYYRIHERPSPAWSGEGLPPVGVVCEANFVGEWKRFEMRYYGEAYVVFKTAFEVQRTRHDFDTCGVKFRPIRTPEQIAADEREAALKHACSVVGCHVGSRYGDVVKKLIDDGYRKQEVN